MDPLSALGIAASIAQFLDVGFRVAQRLTEYNTTNIHDVPKSLQSINTQLPLLLNALSRVKSDTQVDRLDTDTKCILRGVIHGCSNIVNEIEGLMNSVTRRPNESISTKLKKVLSSLKHDERILSLDKNLQTYIQVLILHHVVDSADVPAPPLEETKFYEVRERAATPFVERAQHIEKLDEFFHDAARSQVKKPTVVVLQGDKGSGKSQIALSYCQQSFALGQFQSVFWLNAGTPESLELSLESIAAIIRRSTEGGSHEKLRFAKAFLEDLWHPWLLVLDGYDHKAFGYEPVLARLPERGYGAILITTRQLGASSLGTVIEVQKYLSAEEEETLNYSLRKAVENLDWPKVQNIVSQGFNVNQLDLALGWPFLNRAALLGFDQAVDLFLRQGADMNLKPDQCTPLEWAASKGSVTVINRLLDEEDRRQERLKEHQYAACMARAVEDCHLPIVKILVERRGVGVETTNHYGQSGFTKTISGGDIDLLRYLIQHGASPKTPSAKAEALIEAVDGEYLEILRILIEEAKFDPNAKTENHKTALYKVAEVSGKTDTGESQGMEIIRYLLAHGADPMLTSTDGEIPLHAAALGDQVDKVEILLKYGSDVTYKGTGWTPIDRAARYSSLKVFPILLSWPIKDPMRQKTYREETLQVAARWGKRELLMEILKMEDGVDVNAVDSSGQTALLIAIENGCVPVARMLIRNNARQDIADKEGQYPILAAARKGLELVVRDLIKVQNSLALQIKDKDENSALHLAAKGQHENTIKVLLEGGADRDDMNVYGETALDIAEERKMKEVVKVLEDMTIGKK